MAATFSRALAFKAAFLAICQTLYDGQDVTVTYGTPAEAVFTADIVSLGAVRSEQDWATITPNRTRDEALELDIDVWSSAGGGDEAEEAAAERGYTLLGQLEQYIRTVDADLSIATGTPQFARFCRLLGHTSTGRTDPENLFEGRSVLTTATFGARCRITS